MQVIDGFHALLSVDKIAWSDGAGWLLCLVILWFAAAVFSIATSRT